MIPRSIKRLSIILAALVMWPADVLAAHHPAHRAAQPADGSGSLILIIIIVIAIVGFIWFMTRGR